MAARLSLVLVLSVASALAGAEPGVGSSALQGGERAGRLVGVGGTPSKGAACL